MAVKANIEKTAAGYVAYAWTGKGIFAVTLPCERYDDAKAALKAHAGEVEICNPAAGEKACGISDVLCQYFKGKSVDFSMFEVDYTGFTSFQKDILEAVRKVPYGTTVTYKEAAGMAGRPRANRAAGSALGANRTLYLVPCHRVIKSSGDPGGFGSGPEWKRWLLRLEGLFF